MEFYVYIYLDPRKKGSYKYDNKIYEYEPFYVGKGKNNRYKAHINDAKNTRSRYYNCHRSKKIRKILSKKLSPIIIFEKKNLKESDAHLLEIELITKIGRFDANTGPLCNQTSGGEGIKMLVGNRKGIKMSEEHKQKMIAAKTGIKLGPHSVETRRKMSEKRKGIKFTKEHKKNLSKARKLRVITNETREKQKNTSTGKINIKKYKLIDPNGNIHYTTNGLTQFCKQNNLTRPNFNHVLKGTRTHHKGWKIESL